MRKILIVTALLLCTGFACGQCLENGNIVAVSSYEVILKPNVTMNQWIEFNTTKWKPAWEKAFPGLKIYIVTGERGASIHRYGEIWVFESKEIRDKYWPTQDGETHYPEGAEEILAPVQEEGNKYILSATRTYTDWKIL
jgi:hypothetical protein